MTLMPTASTRALFARPSVVLVAVACVASFGCKAKELGANVSDTQAISVDHTWVVAARSCWPSLAHGSEKYVADSLADPLAFRGAFTAYATYTDAELESMAAHNIAQAPAPDAGLLRDANQPLLTRTEASTQQQPKATGAADSRDDQQSSPETLCAIHPGRPVGFR